MKIYGSSNLPGILMTGYSQLNNVRLQMALAKREESKPSAPTMGSASGSLGTEDMEFLKKYQSHMLGLQSAANKIIKGEGYNRLEAGAESTSVAEVSGKLGSASDQYTLTVEQLAAGQLNQSVEMNGSDPLPSMSGSLKIQTEKGSFSFYLSAAGANDNREMLNNFAKKINGGKAGITASVQEKDGKVSLQLVGESGEKKSFSVSGSLAQRLGMENSVRCGQDAVYTIQKNNGEIKRVQAESNDILLDKGLKGELKGVGTTLIRGGVDNNAKLANAVAGLVDQFNQTLHFLNRNADRGVGVLHQIRRMVMSPASETDMNSIGIYTQKDGSLVLDREMFLDRMQRSPSLAEGILEKVAVGIRNDAQMGMRESSGSLLSEHPYFQHQVQPWNNAQQSTMNFLNLYTRSGSYNLMNYYAIGSLMNISI